MLLRRIAPTKSMSTVIVEPDKYTILGRAWLDILFFVGIAVACFVAAVILFVIKSHKLVTLP